MIVIDASIALAWGLPDEGLFSAFTVLKRVQASGAAVPTLWYIEMDGTLLRKKRGGRIGAESMSEIISDLSDLDLQQDLQFGHHVLSETLALADKHNLTVYDACYLELAKRLRLPLATLDGDLAAAALAESLTVIPEP